MSEVIRPLEQAKLQPRHTVSSERGLRPYQEDRFVVDVVKSPKNGRLDVLAVMDGHVGYEVAELASLRLVPLLQENLTGLDGDIESALRMTLQSLNEETRAMYEGSTLSVVVIPEDQKKAFIAILGDSPVIIRGANGAVNISPEHNARSNEEERKSAIERGAEYERGYLVNPANGSGLQISRALGDSSLDSFLNRESEIYSVDLDKDSFIIVATDGVFDPTHEDTEHEINRLVDQVSEGSGAADLVRDAIARRTEDNATAIVWRHS